MKNTTSPLRQTFTVFLTLLILAGGALVLGSFGSSDQEANIFRALFSRKSDDVAVSQNGRASILQADIASLGDLGVADSFGDGVLAIDGDSINSVGSFIVTFDAEPVGVKQKQILDARGVTLPSNTTPEGKQIIARELQKIKPQLDSHKTLIQNQQKGLVDTLDRRFGVSSKEQVRNATSYQKEDGTVVSTTSTKVVSNSITVKNVTREELDEILAGVPNVKRVEPTRQVSISVMEAAEVVNAIPVWDYLGVNGVPLTGEGVTIGIVDTGVDYMHPDFGSCDFSQYGDACKVAGGYDFVHNDPDPRDDHGHGTHVASTAAGRGTYLVDGEVVEFRGVAPDAKIYAYKVLSAGGSGSNSDVISGIEACADPNGDGNTEDHLTVCSLSLGSPNGSPMESDALAADAASDVGVIMTIAAGNNGPSPETIGSPGTSRKAITVGASCKPNDVGGHTRCLDNKLANFSSRGPVEFVNENGEFEILNKPDIVAPGVNICAAQYGSYQSSALCLGTGEHIAINGTSMATPVVAGVAALLAQAHPEKTPDEVKEVIKLTAQNLDPIYGINEQGFGLVNALEGLLAFGVPNSFVAINGSPVYFVDEETGATNSFAKTIAITNTLEETITVDLSLDAERPGLAIDFPESFTLDPNESQSFQVTIDADHREVSSGSTLRQNIMISYGEDVAKVPIIYFLPRKMQLDKEFLYYPLFHSSETQYSETLSVNLTNRMTEQDIEYDVEVIGFFDQPEIEVVPGSDTVVLGPGQDMDLDITINATDDVPVGMPLTGEIRLVSDTEIINLPMKLYRGYGVTLYFNGEYKPQSLLLRQEASNRFYVPISEDQDMFTVYLPNGDEWAAMVNLIDDTDNDINGSVIHYAEFTPATSNENIVSIDIEDQDHQFSFDNEFDFQTCMYQFYEGVEGPMRTYFGGDIKRVKYNAFPSEIQLSVACGDINRDTRRVVLGQVMITENINDNHVFSEGTAESSVRYAYTQDQSNLDAERGVGYIICNERDFEPLGGVKTDPTFCLYRFNDGVEDLTFGLDKPAIIEAHAMYTQTPDELELPIMPLTILHTFDIADDGRKVVATTPELFLTEDKIYAWNSGSYGVYADENAISDFYENHKVEFTNNEFIPIGIGPMIDTGAVRSYQQEFNFISNNKSSNMFPYTNGGLGNMISWRFKTWPVLFEHFVDGEFVTSELMEDDSNRATWIARLVDTEGSIITDEVAYGQHQVVSTYQDEASPFVPVSTRTFSVEEEQTDRTPPVLESIKIVADEIEQSVYDPETTMSIEIAANAGKGFASHETNPAYTGGFILRSYLIEYFQDSITDISLVFEGEEVSLTLEDGVYTAELPQIDPDQDFVEFNFTAQDQAGNEFMQTFALPVGSIITREGLEDEEILNCVPAHPTVTFEPLPMQVSPGEQYPISVYLQNNNSQGCGTSAFQIDIESSDNDVLLSTATNPTYVRKSLAGIQIYETGTIFPIGMYPGESGSRDFILHVSEDAQVGDIVNLSVSIFENPFDYHEEYDDFVEIGLVNIVDGGIDSCTRAQPTVEWGQIPAAMPEGGPAQPFSVSITNNDSASCLPSEFEIELLDNSLSFASGEDDVLQSSSEFNGVVAVAPGQTEIISGFVQSFDTLAFPNISVAAVVNSPNHALMSRESAIEIANVCLADLNGDYRVNSGDLAILLTYFGASESIYDVTGDLAVNSGDLGALVSSFGTVCPEPTGYEISMFYAEDTNTQTETQTPEVCPCEYNVVGATCLVNGYDQNDMFAQSDLSSDTLLDFYAEFGCPSASSAQTQPGLVVESRFLESGESTPLAGDTQYDYVVRITNNGGQTVDGLVLERVVPIAAPGTVQVNSSIASVDQVEIQANGSVILPSLSPKQEIVIYLDLSLPASVCSRSAAQDIYQERGLCQ